MVYFKPPFGGPAQVLDYLGRYTHRLAISDYRLVAFKDGKVTFHWKDRKRHDRTRTMTPDADEFIRHFLMHILPKGFAKIRNFGFLANRHRRCRLSLCRQLLNAQPPENDLQLIDWKIRYQALTGTSLDICPFCRQGRMHLLQILPPLWNQRFDSHPITSQNRIHSP